MIMYALHFVPGARASRLPLPLRLASLAFHAWQAYWRWQARRATVRILRSLDGRTLRDIGIDPAEIDSVVYGRPSDRLHTYHEDWAARS
jgi:uncharacterized protein YjiS (DUF1127 family)